MRKATLTYKIGNDKTVNRLGYGAMQLTGTGVFGEVDDRQNAIQVLQAAVGGGVNFIDTAEAYGPQLNETLIADALAPYKADIVIATKGGFERPGPANWVINGHPDFISNCIEGSLKRLKVDAIDLWQLHRIDPKVPLQETLAPVADAVKAGKIKHVGLSEVTIRQLEQARNIVPVAAVQNLYNLTTRKWDAVVDYTAEHGIAFIPWYPLAAGPQKLADKIGQVAEAHNATVAQIALAWLLRRSPNILLIPGTKSLAHLQQNLAAANIELTDEEFDALSN